MLQKDAHRLQPLQECTVKLNWEASVNRNSKLLVLWHLEHEFTLEYNTGVIWVLGEYYLFLLLKLKSRSLLLAEHLRCRMRRSSKHLLDPVACSVLIVLIFAVRELRDWLQSSFKAINWKYPLVFLQLGAHLTVCALPFSSYTVQFLTEPLIHRREKRRKSSCATSSFQLIADNQLLAHEETPWRELGSRV